MPPSEDTGFRYCECQDGFSGPRCSKYCPLDCQNGGYCMVTPVGGALGLEEQLPTYDPNDYMCKCYGHFTGKLCDIPYTNCGESERCYNGGECLVGDDMKHKCSCSIGFSGDSCEIRLDIKEEVAVVMTDEGRFAVLILSSLFVVLGIALCVMLRRRRKLPVDLPPKHIHVDSSAPENDPSSIFRTKDNIISYHPKKESRVGAVQPNIV